MGETTAGHEFLAQSARILIIDADPGAVEALSHAVTALGHTVCHAAAPGPASGDLPASTNPDLALIGLDAGEVAVEAAERVAERFGVPLVYVTEATDVALVDRADRTNPQGYVLKSADPRELALTIRTALSVHRKAAARASRAKFFTSLFVSMNDAVVVADSRGRVVAVNEATRRFFPTYDRDTDPNEWIDSIEVYQADGQTPLAPEDRPIQRAIRGEISEELVLVLRPRQPGTGSEDIRFVVSAYPLLDAGGRLIGGAILLRQPTDASEQSARARRAEVALNERAQVLDAVIRSMDDGVVVADAHHRFTLFNPAAERILGIGMTDQPPEKWPRLYGVYYADGTTPVPPDELPLVRAAQGETVEDLDLFIRNLNIPDGAYISVNASPLRDEEGKVVGGVTVFRDVSQRRREQEALTQAFARGRLEIIDTVLHNIGNAISSVTTGVDTLHERHMHNELVRRFNALAKHVRAHDHDWTAWLEHDAQGRKLRPFLLSLIRDLNNEQEMLRKTAARVRDRVRHIVDIIRTQESFTDGTVERQQVNLARAIQDAIRVIQESLDRRGAVIEVDCSQAPAEILVQESRFQQMLVNLLKNAMEAIDERAALPENAPGWQPAIRLIAYRPEEDGFLVLDIIDNGIGIEPSRFRSVFNAGYTTKKNGSGLGLHSAANFVIGSGGRIQPLSDGIGHGTTIRVRLRLVAPSLPADRAGTESAAKWPETGGQPDPAELS